jgi:very-short-patch-repair endonuclease
MAARQKNLITYAQARQCGLSSHQVRGLVGRGEWDRIFRGVFVVGPNEPAWQQRVLAVCLAGGHGVAASHETAAALMFLDGVPADPRMLHVSTLRSLKIRDDAVMIHETTRPFGIKKALGVPATYVERVLLDLAAALGAPAIELALEDALRRRLTSIPRLDATLSRDGGKGRPGTRVLAELVEARRASAPTDSALETRAAAALAKAGLVGMVKQHPVTRPDGSLARIDLAFPHFKIAVEVESYRWHSGRQAWHRDLARRNDLIALGWTVLHVTKEDVDERCRTLARTIRDLMGIRSFDEA